MIVSPYLHSHVCALLAIPQCQVIDDKPVLSAMNDNAQSLEFSINVNSVWRQADEIELPITQAAQTIADIKSAGRRPY